MDGVRIKLDAESIRRLEEKYGVELVDKAAQVVDVYTRKIAVEAKRIISDEGHRDTGKLINSIKPSLKAYATKIVGEVNAGAKYARFIHEGAKHDGDDIKPHFVPFRVAETLWQWLVRHDIIYRKTKTGKRAKRSSNAASTSSEKWYFTSKRTGKEYPVSKAKGGWVVMARPTKFFERPFEALKDEFVAEMSALVGGSNG
jgi:hypothetical protein